MPPDIAESIFIIPILNPIKAPTIPTKTATANGPESATAFAPCANKKNPPLINATPAPSIINALADASIFLELAALLLPTASCPLEIPNNFPAILLIPAPASPAIALVNAPTNGATLFAILKPLYATKSCGSFDITFAIISECSSRNPAKVFNAPLAESIALLKELILSVEPNAPVIFPKSSPIAEKASPKAIFTSNASVFKTFQYPLALSRNPVNFPAISFPSKSPILLIIPSKDLIARPDKTSNDGASLLLTVLVRPSIA